MRVKAQEREAVRSKSGEGSKGVREGGGGLKCEGRDSGKKNTSK